jgi:hypothetical protein
VYGHHSSLLADILRYSDRQGFGLKVAVEAVWVMVVEEVVAEVQRIGPKGKVAAA